jgi:hypothetical protein
VAKRRSTYAPQDWHDLDYSHRQDDRFDCRFTPEQIEARRRVVAKAKAQREAFRAPIVVNGRTVAHVLIHQGKIIDTESV